MNRQARGQVAQETLDILRTGQYTTRHGQRVDVSAPLQAAIQNTHVIRPEQWAGIQEAAAASARTDRKAAIEVTGETTLAALHRLIVDERCERVAALNFASAKNAGGGFLSGSQAQEESLARSSGLYATIEPQHGYYDANRRCNSTLYTDHAIFSPKIGRAHV